MPLLILTEEIPFYIYVFSLETCYINILRFILDDPSETKNLASENPLKVKTMLRKLDEYRKNSLPAVNPDYLPKNITHPNGILRLDWC